MTFVEYLRSVEAARIQHPAWRLGQAYFNVLYSVRPDLADRIRATIHDPFYDDSRIANFLLLIVIEFSTAP